MKKKLTAILLVVASMGYSYDVYEAIAEIESNTNDNAVNVKEDAVGRYQIRPIYVEDVNRISGMNFTLEDRKNPKRALEMVKIYTSHYGKIYTDRTGLPVTDEVIARIHNGGSWRGAVKECTEKYWRKVKTVLDK